jgi:deoxycytidylate deaminase
MTNFTFDWADLAFSSKTVLTNLKATFIAAPRDISEKRFTQLLKEYLPVTNILLGISKEDFVEGLENQPQFEMLKTKRLRKLIDKVNASSPHKVYTLHYFQRELNTIIDKVKPKRAVFINGSWYHSFHTLPIYYTLASRSIPYELVSAFANEAEALEYEKDTTARIKQISSKPHLSDQELLTLANETAKQSFDHTFQTGAVLAKKTKTGYDPLLTGFNGVIPYQTFALLNGSLREKNFSPPNDQNYYDAIHAEMALLVEAAGKGISLKGLSLCVNLMPCPSCARTLSQTDLTEIVYSLDHSEGYAVGLLEKSGKTVRRIVY